MNEYPTAEEIIAIQPTYKSPPGFDSWTSHIKTCADALLQTVKHIKTTEDDKAVDTSTARIIYGIYYHALGNFAPAYYLAKPLTDALCQTSPILPAYAPIALPSFHLMLPAGVVSANPASVTACCVRNTPNSMFKANDKYHKDCLILGVNVRIDRSVIAYTVLFTPDFSQMQFMPEYDEIGLDSFDQGLLNSLRTISAKLVVNTLLILQYQPELLTEENPVASKGTGFGLKSKNESIGYLPTRWLGKTYQYKQSRRSQTESHASPRAHWRKGHWHNFRHGPGRKKLKLKWIEPIFVNP